MSSEALERLRTNARVHHTNGDVTLTALSSDVDALLAALADARERAEKAERERDEALSVREGLISPVQKVLQLRDALAVAREREQRAIERLEQQVDEAVGRWHDNDPREESALHEWLGLTWDEYAAYVQGGVAALVDEPAADEPRLLTEDRSEIRQVPDAVRDVWTKQRPSGYTREAYEKDKAARAAADEPGETPA